MAQSSGETSHELEIFGRTLFRSEHQKNQADLLVFLIESDPSFMPAGREHDPAYSGGARVRKSYVVVQRHRTRGLSSNQVGPYFLLIPDRVRGAQGVEHFNQGRLKVAALEGQIDRIEVGNWNERHVYEVLFRASD